MRLRALHLRPVRPHGYQPRRQWRCLPHVEAALERVVKVGAARRPNAQPLRPARKAGNFLRAMPAGHHLDGLAPGGHEIFGQRPETGFVQPLVAAVPPAPRIQPTASASEAQRCGTKPGLPSTSQ